MQYKKNIIAAPVPVTTPTPLLSLGTFKIKRMLSLPSDLCTSPECCCLSDLQSCLNLPRFSNVTHLLISHHWPPVSASIKFKPWYCSIGQLKEPICFILERSRQTYHIFLFFCLWASGTPHAFLITPPVWKELNTAGRTADSITI